MAKLTDRQKQNIIALYKTGQYTKRGLAKKYKVAETSIRRIVADITPTNSHIVEKGVELEKEKSRISVAEQRAVETAVKEKTAQERMRDVVLDNSLKISVHTTTASMKKLQENSASKKKMEASELIEHQRLAKLAKETVTVKEEKTVVENNLNMQQMVLSQEETNVNVTVVDLESEELVQLFKDRNLPT
jgi:transposase-like protein